MAYKLDIRGVIRDHLKTLVNDNTGRPDGRDYFFFFVLPIIVSILLLYFKIFIDKIFIGPIISGLSIFIALSLNLNALLFQILKNEKTSNFKKSFVKEIIANTSFSILLSIGTIFVSLLTLMEGSCWLIYITNGVAFFFLTEMALHIVLLVKRMYYQLIEQSGKSENDD